MNSMISGGSLRRPSWPACDKTGRSVEPARKAGSRPAGMIRSNTRHHHDGKQYDADGAKECAGGAVGRADPRAGDFADRAAQERGQNKADHNENGEEGQ